ncbi:SPOR domain-containing protein [Novosphingobium flavum]|uniref:SPOR domain-containing protein n=2 Tax=Novosphingobium flavum TaxID=1778672 RepID=A0A7X1FVP3_9SPHN|nr:SPOR domain-containing protein [Novosphingobium flavum]
MRWVCGAALGVCGGALAAGLVGAGAAMADVKAGADAWGRGDYAAAIREWQGPAEKGDPDAQFDLGQAYRLGRGVPRDLSKAEALFAKAAAQGHVQAADNYGLLLFDRGERQTAMAYVKAAAGRGDPRAQYLLGIAHFNGDLAPKDWPRAYALMTLAQGAGLAQARAAIAQMDESVPLDQRQAGVTLAARLGQEAEAQRATQLAAADLADPTPVPAGRSAARPAPRPDDAVTAAVRTSAGSSPATAGADYARPAAPPKPASPVKPAPIITAKPATAPPPKPAPVVAAKPAAAPKPAPKPAVPASGPWRVQLGAFGVSANADALWAKARARPELAGHPRINVTAGKVIKLQAGGFASRESAAAACSALARSGLACVPAQD